MSDNWQPIETAPKMRDILLFAVTDRKEDGSVSNYKMETGFWSEGHKKWCWPTNSLDPWEVHPTHWQELPEPPALTALAILALGFAAALLFTGAFVGISIAWGFV